MNGPASDGDIPNSEELSTVRCIVAALRANFALLIAGSLAYSAFMSVLPLFTLAFVLAATFGGQQLIDQILTFTGQYLVPVGQDIFIDAIQNRTGRAATSVISGALVLWSSLRVFRTLDSSFSMFYNTTGTKSFVQKTRDSLVVLVAFVFALVSSVVVPIGARYLPAIPLGWLVGPALLVVPLSLAFLPIYYVFPDTDVSLGEVLPGVFFTAGGWSVLPVGFQLYIDYASRSEVYGTLGAVLLVMTWLYAAGLLLLIGIAVNVVVAGRTDAALARPPSPADVTSSG